MLSYVRDSVCLVCGTQSVLCVGFSLCDVQSLDCLMCGRAVFSMYYVVDLVCVMFNLQSRSSSGLSEHASLRSVGQGPTRAQGGGPCWAQGKGPARVQGQKLRAPPQPPSTASQFDIKQKKKKTNIYMYIGQLQDVFASNISTTVLLQGGLAPQILSKNACIMHLS